MSWLIFYPRTLWRTISNPDAVTAYSDAEQDDKPDEQYTETLSPPLLLPITVVLTYGLAHWIGNAEPMATTKTGKAITGSAKNLLLLRALIFAIIPLVVASIGLVRNRIAIDRKTLRRPFYSQCFLVAPFALMLQTGIAVHRLPGIGSPAGIALGLIAFLWFGGKKRMVRHAPLDCTTHCGCLGDCSHSRSYHDRRRNHRPCCLRFNNPAQGMPADLMLAQWIEPEVSDHIQSAARPMSARRNETARRHIREGPTYCAD